MNSLPKTVTRQRRGCELNPGPSAPEFSTLTTRLPSHHGAMRATHLIGYNSGGEFYCSCGLRSRFSTRSCTYGDNTWQSLVVHNMYTKFSRDHLTQIVHRSQSDLARHSSSSPVPSSPAPTYVFMLAHQSCPRFGLTHGLGWVGSTTAKVLKI